MEGSETDRVHLNTHSFSLHIHYVEDVLQDVELLAWIVDTDGSSADLAAVQHQVVVLAADLRKKKRIRGRSWTIEIRTESREGLASPRAKIGTSADHCKVMSDGL